MAGETDSWSSQFKESEAAHRSPTWLKLPKKEPISRRYYHQTQRVRHQEKPRSPAYRGVRALGSTRLSGRRHPPSLSHRRRFPLCTTASTFSLSPQACLCYGVSSGSLRWKQFTGQLVFRVPCFYSWALLFSFLLERVRGPA